MDPQHLSWHNYLLLNRLRILMRSPCLYYSMQWQVLEERIAGTPKAQYVWSPVYVDALVERDRDANGVPSDGPRMDGLEERLYAQQDANWNVTALVDGNGNVVERYVEDPYGQVTVLTAAWADRGVSLFAWVYLHQGGRFENISATYHFRNRDLSLALGRWLQRDPIEYTGSGPDLYLYIHNRPVGAIDPSGLRASGLHSESCEQPTSLCGPSATSWFFSEFLNHGKFWYFRFAKEKAFDPVWQLPPQLRVPWFIPYAATIPYKWMSFDIPECPVGEKCKGTVNLCGTCIHKSELGNIMYGAMAKLALETEPLIVIGAVGRGGTNDPESMAGILGGLVLGSDWLLNSRNIGDMCRALGRDSARYLTAIRDKVSQLVKEDAKVLALIKPLTGKFLDDMGQNYRECKPCPKPPRSLKNSSLNAVTGPGGLKDLDHKKIYDGLEVTWPEGLR